MTRLLFLAPLLLAACASTPPAVPSVNWSTANVLFRGTPEAVLDSVVTVATSDSCLAVRRSERGLLIADMCEGQENRAAVVVEARGDGFAEAILKSEYRVLDRNYRDFPIRLMNGLGERGLAYLFLPARVPAETSCLPPSMWIASLDSAYVTDAPGDSADVRLEVPPELIGGLEGLTRSVQYPESARQDGIQGTTLVRFIVDEAGAVSCAEILVTQDIALDEAALTAVRAARFSPGTQDGVPVKVRYFLPVTFRLN